MKILVIGGNRFMGLRLTESLDRQSQHDLHILNRTGQAPHCKNAAIHKGDRRNLYSTFLDKDWDAIIDFACFTAEDARTSLAYFQNVKRYIMISTSSVYDPGPDRTETAFDPRTWDSANVPEPDASRGTAYQLGKRGAEAELVEKTACVFVRFPFVLGPDDYTQRLQFHIEHIQKNQPIGIANLEARTSLLHAEDAHHMLEWCLTQTFTGPINVAAPKPIAMGELVAQIEVLVNRKAIVMTKSPPEHQSPYAPEKDSFLNVELAKSLGFEAKPISAWLPGLISELAQTSSKSPMH